MHARCPCSTMSRRQHLKNTNSSNTKDVERRRSSLVPDKPPHILFMGSYTAYKLYNVYFLSLVERMYTSSTDRPASKVVTDLVKKKPVLQAGSGAQTFVHRIKSINLFSVLVYCIFSWHRINSFAQDYTTISNHSDSSLSTELTSKF